MPQAAVRRQRARAVTAPSTARSRAMTWTQAVDQFLATKESENLSPATIENYAWHLGGPRARTFLADHQISSPRQLTAELLRDLQRELLAAGVSPALAHAFHRVWKNFAGFCISNGYGADPAVLAVKGPKQPMVEPATFTEDEEQRLLAVAVVPRDRLILEVLLRTGLRLEEVCTLTIDDVVVGPEGAYLRVRHGKGAKDRIVPMDTSRMRLSRRVQQYIKRDRPTETSSRALFLSTRRSPRGEYEPLTSRGLQLMVRRLGKAAGVHAHPHKFRHTFATRSLAAGVDVMALQRVLGHTTLAMVARYVHYQKGDLIEAWKRRRD
jgi:integrase/recombinase XerD